MVGSDWDTLLSLIVVDGVPLCIHCGTIVLLNLSYGLQKIPPHPYLNLSYLISSFIHELKTVLHSYPYQVLAHTHAQHF